MAACKGGADGGGDTVFSTFRPVDPSGWRYTDTLVLPLTAMTDTVGCRGDVAVTVRHSNNYPYSNLWMELILPDGTARAVCVELADVFGRWYGNGMGLTFERTDTVLRGITLGPSDTLRLHHNMRIDTVPSIEQIGLFFIRQ